MKKNKTTLKQYVLNLLVRLDLIKARKFEEVEITNARVLTLRVYNKTWEKWEKKRVLSDFFSLQDNYRFIQELYGENVQIIDFRQSDISFMSGLPASPGHILRLPINGYNVKSMLAYRKIGLTDESSRFRFSVICQIGANFEDMIRESAKHFFRVTSNSVRFERKSTRTEVYDAIFYMNDASELNRDIKRYDGFINEGNLKEPLNINFEHKSNF